MPSNNQKNIAIVCNTLAGLGTAVEMANRIAGLLAEKSIHHTIFNEAWPMHFNAFTDVFIVGGDGTLNYFINQYIGIQTPLVIFKGGTGNDFHWLLYGNQQLAGQLETVLNAEPKPVDIGKCNERYFINGVGIGFEGAVVKALTGKQKRPGKTSFFITILKKIFTYRLKNYTIISAEENVTGKKLLVDISNGRRAGGGFHIAPEAKADDGLFDIIIADALNAFQCLRYLPVIEKGKHLHLSFIHHFQTKQLLVESDSVIQYHLDGEYAEAKSLLIEIFPAKVNFKY
jgi:YegS/Rv2252/BmrU family lipid kinase